MSQYTVSHALRFFFLFASTVLWIGIWQTGFETAFWLLYLPAIFFAFAAITGICPGILFSKWLFKEKST